MLKSFRSLAVFFAALFLPVFVFGQSPGGNGAWSVVGYVLTTTPVSLASIVSSGSTKAAPPLAGQNVWVCWGDVNAAAGTSATISIKDGNGAYYWNGVAPLSSTAASSVNIPFGAGGLLGCRLFPSGILVSASAGSTITFSAGGTL